MMVVLLVDYWPTLLADMGGGYPGPAMLQVWLYHWQGLPLPYC